MQNQKMARSCYGILAWCSHLTMRLSIFAIIAVTISLGMVERADAFRPSCLNKSYDILDRGREAERVLRIQYISLKKSVEAQRTAELDELRKQYVEENQTAKKNYEQSLGQARGNNAVFRKIGADHSAAHKERRELFVNSSTNVWDKYEEQLQDLDSAFRWKQLQLRFTTAMRRLPSHMKCWSAAVLEIEGIYSSFNPFSWARNFRLIGEGRLFSPLIKSIGLVKEIYNDAVTNLMKNNNLTMKEAQRFLGQDRTKNGRVSLVPYDPERLSEPLPPSSSYPTLPLEYYNYEQQ